MKPNRKITPADLAAAARLSAIWKRKQREFRARGESLTQEKAGLDLGWTQGAVSQYLRGKLALSYEATVKFARYLSVHPNEIRPEMDFTLPNLADVDDHLLAHLRDYSELDEESRAAIDVMTRKLKNSGG